jgi:hypothetical protein
MTDAFRDFFVRLFTGTWPLVTYQTIIVTWIVSAILILGLYVVKAWLLRRVANPRHAALLFACIAGFCVPVTWAVCPDWNKRNVFPIANYVGDPIMTLTVPCLSFAYDLIRRMNGARPSWLWRLPIELLAIPCWVVAWAFFELLVLGWVWI